MKLRTITPILASILFSSYVIADGYQEPGYLNYNASESTNVTLLGNAGRELAGGIFEPGYVNYQFDRPVMDIDALTAKYPTAAGDSSGFSLATGHINQQGVYEPLYLDFNLNN